MIGKVCLHPALLQAWGGKVRWVLGLLYDVHACAGKRWKAELHEGKEIDEDNM